MSPSTCRIARIIEEETGLTRLNILRVRIHSSYIYILRLKKTRIKQISHNGYRYLAAIESNLSREKAISEQKILDPDKIIHIIDEDVVETVINSVGEAGI